MTSEARTLKDALYHMIHRHPTKSLEAIAEEIGMARSYLTRAALPDPDIDDRETSGVRFPLKKLIPLTRATGDYAALDYIERALDRVAVPVPQVSSGDCAELSDHAIKAAAEFGDLMREAHAALADGKITRYEREVIAREGYEAVQAIMMVVLACGGET